MPPFLDEQKPANLSMLTDLYELTMCASYLDNNMFQPATFDLFIRRLPENRGYLLTAGLEQALNYIENIKFTNTHLNYLKKQGFNNKFIEYLQDFEFTGDIYAMPEGTITFPCEPIIRVTAPIIEAQLIETFLLNTINLQTTLATKASRVVQAAKGKPIIEFGLRREQGIDAGMKAARVSYIAGCQGTSNVLAGMTYNIPIFGTMAHSFIMAFNHEIDAFRAFAKTFPNKSTLLIDTYNNLQGAQNAITIAKELKNQGHKPGGVRLDSGNLTETSKKIRQLLDENGLNDATIFASGDLDEYRIQELLQNGARIDAFGVGTRMGTSADKPYVDVIYKLCETQNDEGNFQPIMKLSESKITLPGRKQVYRFTNQRDNYMKDVIALDDEEMDAEAEPLLIKVMEDGKRTYELPSLEEVRSEAKLNLSKLPEKYKQLTNPPTYPVELSQALEELANTLTEQLMQKVNEATRGKT